MHKLSQALRIELRKSIIKSLNNGFAVKIRDDYKLEEIKPANNTFSLEELQVNVGGYIEVYPKVLLENTMLFVDEEGLLKKRKYNQLCKDIFRIDVVGDCLLVPNEMLRGD